MGAEGGKRLRGKHGVGGLESQGKEFVLCDCNGLQWGNVRRCVMAEGREMLMIVATEV